MAKLGRDSTLTENLRFPEAVSQWHSLLRFERGGGEAKRAGQMSRTEAMGVTPFAPFVYHASRDDGVGLEFHIVGGEAQILQVLLPPNRSIEAEPGALFYMSGKVKAETKGAGGGIVSAMSRLFSGESFFVNSYVNEGDRPEYVAFATQMINRILPLDLAALGNEIYCQPDSYFCSVGDVRVTSQMTRSLSAGLFGGEGLLLQRIQGTGLCWITAGGTPVQKQLAPGETVLVDAGCLVAFQREFPPPPPPSYHLYLSLSLCPESKHAFESDKHTRAHSFCLRQRP